MAHQETNTEIEEFMESPLMVWFSSCLEDIITHKLTYDELVDGVLIYNVFLKMDIHGQINDVSPPNGDHVQRLKNLQVIMSNMRLFYEEDSIVLKEPELRLIARAAHSNVREVELLLVLLLGCAVKCPNKKNFIERITRLDKSTQEAIAAQIGRVTHFPDVVLCRDMLLVETTDLDDEFEPEEQTLHTQIVYKAFDEVRRIYKDRVELIEREESAPPTPSIPHCMLELNEWKSKALQLKNIEDEYTQELQKYAERLELVEKENSRLVTEAKATKEYRDALDAAMEKAIQAERFEQECARYKEKLEQHESCRSRMEELKRDNQLLQENKEELVSQLDMYKLKVEKMMKTEEQMYKLKEQCDKFSLENDTFQTKIAELSTANEELERKIHLTTPTSPSSKLTAAISNESLNTSFDNSIGEQMSRSTNSQALKLELENRRLSTMVESLRESSFHNSSFKILDLEKEKKRLQLANEDLQSRLAKFEDNLSTTTKEKQQLRSLVENSQKVDDNGEMESRIVALESEKRKAMRELERTQSSLDASAKIIQDLRAKLQALEKQRDEDSDSEDDDDDIDLNSSILKSPPKSQTRLKLDLDNVTNERNVLKLQVRDAQSKLKRQQEMVEQLESTIKRLQAPGSPNAFKAEYVKLKKDFVNLLSEYRKAKSVADELTRRQDENQVEMRAKNARIIELDIYLSKLQHKCSMLSQMTERAETDKRALMDYVAQMLKHNHELVTQTLEDKEHYREEERRNNETVNHLSRAKEKLEEKIMDQFRKMDNKREVKKRSAAVSVVKSTFGKVRRAGSEFFGRSRKSWSDESNSPTEKSDDFEFTRPSDTGTYVNLPRNRKSLDFLGDFEPQDFTFERRNNNC